MILFFCLPISSQSDVLLKDNANLGHILTDSLGNTLYYFTRDAGSNTSNCSGGCANTWPIFFAENNTFAEELDSSDFSSFMREDSTMQSTYKGWPLYYFANDTIIGETNGEARGNVWFVAKPDYSIMVMNDSLVGADGITYDLNYEPGSEVVQFFTDEEGRTIYGFIVDRYDMNNYTKEDFSNDAVWPIYGSDSLGAIPSHLNRELFNTIDVFGRPQFTYKGWPLYYFIQDSQRGDTKGVSVPSPGVWPIITSDIENAQLSDNVQLREDESLGNILTDGQGNTLYYFSRDAGNDFSACNGGCLNQWPVFYVDSVVSSDLATAEFKSFTRSDGTMQTSYKGWPLYYYSSDTIIGETNGEARGNVWFVAKPDYSIMVMNDSLVGADGITYNATYEPGSEIVQFFTDENGRSLYFFINDSLDNNNFTNEDFSNDAFWPVYGNDTIGSLPSTLDRNLFNVIDVFGVPQYTYNGWPLYYWGQDSLRGDTYGVSVPSPGVWPIAVKEIDAAPSATNVAINSDEGLGQILVDGQGNTLYYFTRDAGNDFSACLGGCLNAWPIFHSLNLTPGEGLDASDFTSFTRSDGSLQTSYKGWPLYYYANDTLVGETNGEARGDSWFVAKPDYSIMLLNDSLVGADGVTYNGSYEPGSEVIQFFTDERGRTIYIFANDNFDVNNFTNEDFSNDAVWPIYGDQNLESIPSILDKTLFNTIDVFGRPQFTYNGWPLYYWGQDSLRGDTYGVSVPSPGIWPVAVQGLEAATVSSIKGEIQETTIKVSPNPFADEIKIKINSNLDKASRITLYNGLGMKVKEVRFASNNNEGSDLLMTGLNTLDKGLYYLEIASSDGRSTTFKMIH
jgi:predicted lipoprotein with Yx(FWY)xxD motif